MSSVSGIRLRDERGDHLVTSGDIPAGYVALDPLLAVWTLRRWFHDQRLDRHRQCDLYWSINPPTSDVSRISHAELQRWLEAQVMGGGIRIARGRRASPGAGRQTAPSLAAAQEARAARLGAPVPAHAAPVAIADAGMPYAVYHGSDSATPLPDEDDGQAENPSCPNPYHRSETLESASPAVKEWLRENDIRGPEAWQRTLGGGEKNGGGFLAGSTEVVEVPAGTALWRYVNDPRSPLGTWWFFHPYAGDPRAFGALPPDSTGRVLVRAETTHPFKALCGPGAPRCTNKPGGPPQICVPRAKPTSPSENGLLRLT